MVVRKKCTKCKKSLLLKAFHIDKRKLTGRKSQCADCANAGDRAKKHNLSVRYSDYKKRAKKLGHIFDLSIKQFNDISSQPCEYCGGYSVKNKNHSFNGVDRVNAEEGYFEQNCAPCCTDCNYMKWTKDVSSFIKHIRKIYKFQEAG